jgi:site-specific DNA recombinase
LPTRRAAACRGRVENGKSGGGNAYGYDVVRKIDANGEPIRGTVVRRIFMDFAAGKLPKKIAYKLNQGYSRSRRNRLGRFAINGHSQQ